jgi:hypothetical protein
MLGNGFLGIVRAARVETAAVAQKRTEQKPVDPDQADKKSAYHGVVVVSLCHCCRNIEDTSALSNSSIPLRANSTTSKKG